MYVLLVVLRRKMLSIKHIIYNTINESGCSVNLHDLLNHTCERILLSLYKSSRLNEFSQYKSFKLYCKYGMDGSSNQSLVKQKHDEIDENYCDNSIYICMFIVSLVPLQMQGIHV